MRCYLKKTHHKKRVGGVAQDVGPEFKPQYHKKKKKLGNSVSGMRNLVFRMKGELLPEFQIFFS
jgi:hypothetical protein